MPPPDGKTGGRAHARTSAVEGSGVSGPGVRFHRFRSLAGPGVLAAGTRGQPHGLRTRAAYPHQPAAEDIGFGEFGWIVL